MGLEFSLIAILGIVGGLAAAILGIVMIMRRRAASDAGKPPDSGWWG